MYVRYRVRAGAYYESKFATDDRQLQSITLVAISRGDYKIYSYIESRGGKYPKTAFIGLQYLLRILP